MRAIKELHIHLEKGAVKIRNHWNLTKNFKKTIEETNNKELKKIMQWELFCLDFELSRGDVTPSYSQSNEEGELIWSYPSFSQFTDDTYNYIINRAEKVNNDYLKARYNQVLWNSASKFKNANQAKNAVDAYLRILSIINCNKEASDAIHIVENALHLSFKVAYKVSDLKMLVTGWLFDLKEFPSDSKLYLLKVMTNISQFKAKDYDGVEDLLLQMLTARKKKKPDYYYTKELSEMGLQIAQKSKTNTKIWNERIGDSLVAFGLSRLNDDSKIIPLSVFDEALQYYRAAGTKTKLKSTEKLYFETKKELKLTEIQVPFPDHHSQEIFNYLENKNKVVLKWKEEKIIFYLVNGKHIFPTKSQLIKIANSKKDPFEFINVLKFDGNKNLAKAKESKDAKELENVYETYQMFMGVFVLPHLNDVFINGIKHNKITYKGVIKHLKTKSWLGQNLTHTNSAGKKTNYNWLSMIAPSIYEYFLQIESVIKSGAKFSNYIMPIDSLTLKFEGALRDFAGVIGISTVIAGKNNQLREKYIDELLMDEQLKNCFDENDVLFFNYLFVSKNGINLRNRVAHSFLKPHHYSHQLIHLLLCAFLRLGKYKFKTS